MNESISIVIPTFNRGETLLKVLPSYLHQKNVKEIIIVDDGSTDKTKEYILELSCKKTKIKYFKNHKNLGLPVSRNKGVLNSKTPYIFFGEDDIELSRNHLSILLRHLINNKADIIAGRCICLQPGESKEDALKRANQYKPEPVNYKLIMTNFQVRIDKDTPLPLLAAVMLIRKKVFTKMKYDEHYKRNAWREETDFQISAGEKGYKLYFCPHTVCYHLAKVNNKGGAHTSSLIKYELDIFRFNYYMTKKHWGYITKHFEINNFISYMMRFIIYIIIHKNLLPSLGKVKKLLIRFLVRKSPP